MEWSKVNGDVQINVGRDGAYVSRGIESKQQQQQHSFSGFNDDLTPRTHLEHGIGPQKTRRDFVKSSAIAFAPVVKATGSKTRQSEIQEFSFTNNSSRESHDSSLKGIPFGAKRLSQTNFTTEFTLEQECLPFPVLNEGKDRCPNVDVCSECPKRDSPCDFGSQGICFHRSQTDLPVRYNLRTGADGRLISRESLPSVASDVYQISGSAEGFHAEVISDGSDQDCGDRTLHIPKTLSSHHASHCNLKDFREWRDLRGSRESLGTLPPELERHLRECRCPCDHLGYGNYQTLSDGPVSHITLSRSYSGDICGRKEMPGSSVYTQISYLDSPRSTSSNGLTGRRKVPGELSTRHWWLVGLVFLVAACAGVGVGVPLALRGDPSKSFEQRMESAKTILSESPLIDGHNDLPWNIRSFIHNQLEKLKLNESLKDVEPWSISNWSHTDIPRLKEGRVGGIFWVAYTPCATQYLNTVQLTLEQLDLIKRVILKYKNFMKLVTTSKDIKKVFKEGKIASLVGIEGGHSISNSLGTLRMMYELGARYLTLTHACNTPWATSSVVESEKMFGLEHVGLNDFGKKVVLEMNRLGMMVDLSHVSTQTMKDALATTQAPIIFSHSSARALCKNPRNVPDDVLKQVKNNRGIVMISFYADHINCNGRANVTHVANHINYIRKVAGIDHVGIGADFDGINKTPEGLEDVSKYPQLIAELLRDEKWTEEDIRKLAGENIIRVFSEVEKVRDELQAKGYEPFEEEIHPDYLRGRTNCSYFFDTASSKVK